MSLAAGGLVLLGRHQTRRFNLNDCATASKEGSQHLEIKQTGSQKCSRRVQVKLRAIAAGVENVASLVSDPSGPLMSEDGATSLIPEDEAGLLTSEDRNDISRRRSHYTRSGARDRRRHCIEDR
eukprot:g36191.t1